MSVDATSVIHDIGYRRYDGPRLGRAYAVRSLYAHGVRAAYGFGRSAKAKIFPWIVVGLVFVIAVVFVAIRTQTGVAVTQYWQFPSDVSVLVILFGAVVAPELVSRDLRGGVLPLYFSRPLTRTDYAVAKWAALITVEFALLAAPQLVMFLGGAFSVDGGGAVWREFLDFSRGLAASAVYALVFGSLALLVASLAGRRAVASAMIVAAFLVTTPVYGVLVGLAYADSPDGTLTGDAADTVALAGLVSPMTLVNGVSRWWFETPSVIGDYGPLYGLVAVGLVVVSTALLFVRYRRVAR